MKTEERITELTFEQEQLLPVIRNKYLDKVFKYENFNSQNFDNVSKYTKALYKMCGLKEPEVILVDSPLGCQIAANIPLENLFNDTTLTKKEINDNINKLVLSKLKKDKKNLEYFKFSSYVNYSDYGWISYYSFFNEILDFTEKENFELIEKCVNLTFMSIQLEDYCIVSKYPNFIKRDNNNDLHNIESAAVEFADGYKQHYFHGLFVAQDLFDSLVNQKYTFKQWTKEPNEEIKSLVLAFYEEKFGNEYVFKFISEHLKEHDTYVDKKAKSLTGSMNVGVYTLFKGNVNDIELNYVRCYCPSSDRMFYLSVEPRYNNAKDAIASLCRIPVDLYKHLTSINRQGEMFSFNFDNKGIEKIKLNKVDYNNTMSVEGDIYFSKMNFEY